MSYSELAKQYRPAEHEERIRARWEAAGAFHADPARVTRGEAEPYCIVIPPPNVTARLHLGHALNNTLQDILARAHRMRGFETLWMPGTDHAGIATQAVVERRVWQEEKKRRTDFSRGEFVAKIQAFKDEYEAVITDQLKRMGCSCDWDRQRFTMDEVCAKAVRAAFFRLFRDGLIYRGKRLVNWDPVLQTAVADDECFDEEIQGHFYYMRYPLVHASRHDPATKPGPEGEREDPMPVTWDELARRGYAHAIEHPGDEAAWVTVATTRPETYLGDTAVAVNPADPRAKALRGLFVELPLVGRVIPIIEDAYVVLPEALARDEEEKADPKAKFATGFLKVTPAHDPNDYMLGQTHEKAIRAAGNEVLINVMGPDGSISDKHGWTDVGDARMFVGMTREAARKKVVEEFKARGLMEGVRPHTHSVKHSDRSKAIVEPYLSDQWYVKVTDERLAASANEALVKEQRKGTEASGHQGTKGQRKPDGDGALRFYPARYAKTYEQWHDGIRDWCISRQLWWGHRIPVWELPEQELERAVERLNAVTELRSWVKSGRVAGTVRGEAITAQKLGALEAGREGAGERGVYLCVRDANDTEVVTALERAGFVQDSDVLDTWFSSALWPMSTMGWPEPGAGEKGLLEAFNPTTTLCTAREIITLWVSRMVMFNRYFMAERAGTEAGDGPVPFRNVFIHAVIQDGEGQKMSKSLGNGVDPLDIIETHGSDAMRFTLCQMTTQTQDVRMPVDLICPHTGEVFAPKMVTNREGYVVPAPIQDSPKGGGKRMVTNYGVATGEAAPTAEMPLARNTSRKFELGRNFATKLWNAARFVMGMVGGKGVEGDEVRAERLIDRWMLSRLSAAVEECDRALAEFEFSAYAQTVYDLLWRDFCDWYLEGIKPTVAEDAGQRAVLRAALDTILRLLHPVMPYVTEAVYEQFRQIGGARVKGLELGAAGKGELLCTAGWPRVKGLRDERAEREFERVRGLVTAIREVRAQHKVEPKRKVTLHAGGGAQDVAKEEATLVRTLAGVETIHAAAEKGQAGGGAGGGAAFMFEGAESWLSDLADAVDAGMERQRLEKEIAEKRKSIGVLEGRLANPGYAERAPAAMVQQTREQLAKAQAEVAALEQRCKELA